MGWLGLAGLSCAGFWDGLGSFRTFWDVLICIASLFSRQVQTRLKQSCQFASYKTRQIQSRPWLAGVGWLGWVVRCFGTFLNVFGTFWDVLHHYFLDKFKLVWNNPVNLCHTKVDKSKLVCNNPVNSRHTKLDKSKVGLGWLEWAGWAGLGFGTF